MSNSYICYSLPLAAWLRLKAHLCTIELDPDDSSRAVFVFTRDPDGQLDRDIVDFQSGNGAIAPRVFKGAEIELRNEMFAVLRRGGGAR
jgi:hypothetical protein